MEWGVRRRKVAKKERRKGRKGEEGEKEGGREASLQM
jgi:hypothetical protein